MPFFGQDTASGEVARARLLNDQLCRPHGERRAALAIVSHRLDKAARDVLFRLVAERAKTEPRFAPVLVTLLRGAFLEA